MNQILLRSMQNWDSATTNPWKRERRKDIGRIRAPPSRYLGSVQHSVQSRCTRCTVSISIPPQALPSLHLQHRYPRKRRSRASKRPENPLWTTSFRGSIWIPIHRQISGACTASTNPGALWKPVDSCIITRELLARGDRRKTLLVLKRPSFSYLFRGLDRSSGNWITCGVCFLWNPSGQRVHLLQGILLFRDAGEPRHSSGVGIWGLLWSVVTLFLLFFCLF